MTTYSTINEAFYNPDADMLDHMARQVNISKQNNKLASDAYKTARKKRMDSKKVQHVPNFKYYSPDGTFFDSEVEGILEAKTMGSSLDRGFSGSPLYKTNNDHDMDADERDVYTNRDNYIEHPIERNIYTDRHSERDISTERHGERDIKSLQSFDISPPSTIDRSWKNIGSNTPNKIVYESDHLQSSDEESIHSENSVDKKLRHVKNCAKCRNYFHNIMKSKKNATSSTISEHFAPVQTSQPVASSAVSSNMSSIINFSDIKDIIITILIGVMILMLLNIIGKNKN